jgi:acyl carrier protein
VEDLIVKLKGEIIEQLNFEDLTVDDIDTDAPLFGPEGLGLDSIDALELILILEKKYQIKITEADDGRSILRSVRTMSDFIMKKRA